jgi:branched-chain amino acid aminotransferase
MSAGTVPDEMVLWVDGQLVTRFDTVIRADDHALVGDGVFEAIKLTNGQPFALTRHLDRLVASAQPLGIPVDLTVVRRAVADILETPQAQVTPSWLRVTVTGGSAPMGTGGVGTVPTVVAAVAPITPWGPTANVVMLPWSRNEHGAIAGLKTISYAENVVGNRYARRNGADEGVFPNTAGNVCEGTGTNVWVVKEGVIRTPPLSAGCLNGVTRQLLLEWMPEIVEADIPLADLVDADEAFLTSTSRDVHPIATVNGRRLARVPGPLTQRALDTWARMAAAGIDP